VLSDAGFLQVFVPLEGLLFNTGLDGTGVALADGEVDPHYSLVVNPDNVAVTDAFVQDSTLFPIVAGPWMANNANAKWIGPRTDTAAATTADPAGYVYETTFDLTGLPPGVLISGGWATDNVGAKVQVNGVDVPNIATSPDFLGLTSFAFDSAVLPTGTLVSGVNTLGFEVLNQGAGYTGLRIENIAVSAVPGGVAPVIFVQPEGQSVTTGDQVVLSVQAYGSAELTYQWRFNGADIVGATSSSYEIASTTLADAGDYDVVVTNPVASATSDTATLIATDVPPSITTPPMGKIAGVGSTVEFTVVAEGSPTLTYQWQKGGMDIDGEVNASLIIASLVKSDSGDYSVVVTNPFGNVTSEVATLTVMDAVPGLYNTGVDATGVPLADNSGDDHYTLVVNPDGDALAQPIVEDSSVFPIVAGPWLANSATSKWIGPRFFTDVSAAGDYTYATSFDLTGFDLNSVTISGQWASDNVGADILINGVATGNTSPVFTEFSNFTITSGFVAGLNSLEFVVNNFAVGYTGLKVEGLAGLGNIVPSVELPKLSIEVNGAGNPVVSFVGDQASDYRIERSTNLQVGSWMDLGAVVVPVGGNVSYEDTSAPAGMAYYRVVVSILEM
jgi:hypothetical protein